MNINLNISDELGEQFISASRWMINRPDLTDDRIVKKNIKRYIGDCINDYNKNLALNESSSLVTSLESEISDIKNKLIIAREDFLRAKQNVDSVFTPIDVGPD